MWGAAKNSIGLHPYESSMYSRATNYKKFGFSHFYTLTGPDVISHQDKIDDSPYVSDEATYKSTLEQVKKTKSNQFLQVITMQNHMPYHKWYKHNDFKATSTTDKPLKDDEQESIETYQKGASLTDDATADFLAELDKLGKPVTVVFYGDHLPGIYSSASADDGNSLALHQTDYFIWSNKASGTQGNKIGNATIRRPTSLWRRPPSIWMPRCRRIWRSSPKCTPRSRPWNRRWSTTSKAGTVFRKVRTSTLTPRAIPWPKAISTPKPNS